MVGEKWRRYILGRRFEADGARGEVNGREMVSRGAGIPTRVVPQGIQYGCMCLHMEQLHTLDCSH